ncbi:anti-sigma factor antagonist [Streptomyces sp. 150FB]|uniref:anti-sigma factor antagonist n=1 Tax=Streptomyces sp. 150FB TaxID=1576605 RepID=UPI00099D21B5|nr:anti-sigma factor antagonist [Streptomyces sp. 150FB]
MGHYTDRHPTSCTPDPRPDSSRAAFSRVVHGVSLVQLYGDIDLASVPEVRPQLDAASERDNARLIIDLRLTEFFDSSAVEELRRARRRILERGGRIAVICTDPFGLRILRASGLSPTLPPVSTLEAAMARIRAPESPE